MAKSDDNRKNIGKNKGKNSFSFFHKKWWIKFENTYDKPMEKYLWNKSVDPKTYKKTDFIEQVVSDRNKLFDHVLFLSRQRANATSQFLSLNSIFMSVYAYGAIHTTWFEHFLMVFTFFIISFLGCITWLTKIHSCLQYNTANFAAIRECQKHLPLVPFGDSVIKVLNESRKTVFRPMLEVESWLPKIFLGWYAVIFIYNIIKLIFN